MRDARVVAAVLLLSASGCLGAAPGAKDVADEPSTVAVDWDALGARAYAVHDHRDRSLHQEISQGLQVVGASTLSADGKSLGEYNEADHQRGLVAVAAVTGPGSTMRIVLLDGASLPSVKIIGSFDEPSSYGDVKIDPALPLVYVPYASNRAFSIWDISDLSKPKRVGEAAGPGCHMLHPLQIGGEPYVFCAAAGGVLVYRIVALPTGERRGVQVGIAIPQSDPEVVRYASYYQKISPLGPALLTTPHDMTAQADPLTKQPLLVSAHELQGIRVYDVSAPAAPREISHWRGQGMSVPMDRVHTVGLAAIAGKRIGFAATETFNNVTPSLYIVDFSDWSNPRFLARWNPPGIQQDQGITYSMHNLQVVGDRLYATNFHGGLWVMNVRDPAHPEILALRHPVRDTEYPRPGEAILPGVYNDVNQFWDVIVVDGYVLVTDMSAGIEILHVDGDPAGAPQWDGFT